MESLIKQSTLRAIIAKREAVARLDAKKRELVGELAKQELVVMSAVRHGEPVESGELDCGITQVPKRVTISWKDWCQKLATPRQLREILRSKKPAWKDHLAVFQRSLAPALRRSVRQLAGRGK